MKKLFTFLAFAAFVSNVSFAQIFSEDFEGGVLPTDWTIETDATDGGFVFENAAGASSSGYAFPDHTIFASTNDDACNCDKLAERLITPEIELASTEGVLVLNYDWSFANGDYDADERARVYILVDGVETELAELDGELQFAWQTAGHDISAYNNQTVQFIFDYTDGGGWNYAFGIDDVTVSNLTGIEASMVSIDNYGFEEAGDVAVEFTVSNTAAEEITSFDATWNVNGTDYMESFTSSISYGQTQSFTTAGTFPVTIDGLSELSVTLTSVNGSADNVGMDDMAEGEVRGVDYFTDRVVFIEEATGTWCGWCPRGAVFMDQMHADYPTTTFLSAVHNGDPMVVSSYDNAIGNFIGGYPSGLVDRTFVDVDPSAFPTLYMDAMEIPSIVELNGSVATFDWNTHTLTVDVDCKFTTSVEGDYRLSVVVTEDDVTGTSSAWNQANYYSGGTTSMGGYEDLADPVPAADMVYDHVARALLGGWNGEAGSLPASINYNDINEHTFTWEADVDYNVNNFHVGVLVINNATGEIQNAYMIPGGVVGIEEEEISSVSNFMVYPNPTSDVAHVAFNLVDNQNVRIEVLDLLGKVVYAEDMGQMNSGSQLIDIDARSIGNGLYIFNVYAGNEVISERVSINK